MNSIDENIKLDKETLKPIQEIFSPEDFNVYESIYTRCEISVASEEEIETQLRNLNKEEQSKKLVP